MVTCVGEIKVLRVIEEKGTGLSADDPIRFEVSYWTPDGNKIGEFNQYDDPFNPTKRRQAARKNADATVND